MGVKQVLVNNDRQFLVDLKRISECMVISEVSNCYLTVKKSQVLKEANEMEIRYRLTNKIYKVGREVMIIL